MENRGRSCDSTTSEVASVTSYSEDDCFKPNCTPDLSKEIEVRCTDICNAKCVGILAEKIFDCVYLENLQFADKDEVFVIDNYDPNDRCRYQYRAGDPIYIDDIALYYDYIGIEDDDTAEGANIGEGNICVRYDMENTILSAVPGNAHKACNYPDNVREVNDGMQSTVNLYDEFEGGVSNTKTKCNAESGNPTSKSRVFKQGVRFYVDNLKVRIRGRIGASPFTATKDYTCFGDVLGDGTRFAVNPVEITKKDTLDNGDGCGKGVGLNFTPVNLYGRVSTPNDGRTVTSNINFETCLSAECIETSERYGDSGEGYIRATVGYSFLATNNIRHTTSEELAVFTNPNGVECRDTSRESDCKKEDDGNKTCPTKPTKCRRCGCRG